MIFGESWRSLSANVSTTVAATMTVLIGMFLLGLFIALGSWVVSWSNHVKRELRVKVYLRGHGRPEGVERRRALRAGHGARPFARLRRQAAGAEDHDQASAPT